MLLMNINMKQLNERQLCQREFDMLADQFKFQLSQASLIAKRMAKLSIRLHELKKNLKNKSF